MMATDLIASKANCKLAYVPSGIAPAKQAWFPIINKYETINAAQPSVQINWHMPLNRGFKIGFLSFKNKEWF